jgi:putative aminophosphonate oxidoreductase
MKRQHDRRPHRSFWLQAVEGDADDAPALAGETRADVAIIGGGYVGLWTGIQIKRLEPACDVVVIEQDICGGGASGRNGGFALSWWPKIASLVRLCGAEDGLRVARDSEATIGEIRDFCSAHGIDAHVRQSGWIWTATARAHLGAWESVVTLCERLGVDPFRRLAPLEVAARTGSPVHRAGILERSAATLQPAVLVRGLRRVALQAGVRIYERTRVTSFTRGQPVRLTAVGGAVTAKTLVIATNAWAAGIAELRRSLVAITSDMIVTAPAPEELERLGWTGGECITDSQMMVDYYHVTRDGRVAFGKGGWGIAFEGNIGSAFDRDARRARTVAGDLHRTYPSLANVPITHDWCGPIDRTPNSLPLLGTFSGHPNIVYGVGWSGNGVAPSVIGGKVLASLSLGRVDEWSRYPLVGRPVERFPPEPLKYIGAHLVRAAVVRKERAEMQNAKPSFVAVQLAKLAPAGLEDKQ